MSSDPKVLIPAVFVLRWLEESTDVADFRFRFESYVRKHGASNWTIPNDPD